jgi:hypothetical protein
MSKYKEEVKEKLEFVKRLEHRKIFEDQRAMEMLRPMSGNNPVFTMDSGVEDTVFVDKYLNPNSKIFYDDYNGDPVHFTNTLNLPPSNKKFNINLDFHNKQSELDQNYICGYPCQSNST